MGGTGANILAEGHLQAVPASAEMLQCELSSDAHLFTLLDVPKPAYWPPELNDEDSFRHFLSVAQSGPEADGWGFHYLLDTSPEPHLVGCGGFTGPPDDKGEVEIGYSMLRPFRRQGYASALVRMLVERALGSGKVRRMNASTYPDLLPSIGVLEKCGFRLQGPGPEGTVMYVRDLFPA